MILSVLFSVAASGPALVLKGLDPIDLVAGREVVGSPSYSMTYLRHEYHFASPEHKQQFAKNPTLYAVQTGGACGKMGALTGKGSVDRWAVARGKIFLFASEGCRTAFLANESSYFSEPGKAPQASPEEQKSAVDSYNAMRRAHGGNALKSIRSIEWTYETPYQESGKAKIWKSKYACLGNSKVAQWEEWDAGLAFFALDGKRTADGKPGEVFGMHPQERRELLAKFARHPAGILMGVGGKVVAPLKDGKGFVMSREDIVFTVKLDSATSRIAEIAYRDKYSGPVADVTVAYSDYESIEGVALPNTAKTKVGAGQWGSPKTVSAVKVNGSVPDVFRTAFGTDGS